MKLADSLRLVEDLKQCASSQEVGAAFAGAIAPHGFTMASCGGSRETSSGRVWEFFFNSWPHDWLLEYQNNDYVRHDMIPAMARQTTAPFTWRELLRTRACTPQQEAFHCRVRELGVVDGLAVPIHHAGGYVGLCVSVATHPIENTEERLALHLASLYAHERCRILGGSIETSAVRLPLSPRELECLKWVLDGKSDTDIGAILGISPTTAHFHIERAKKKLGVRTRMQAAAMIMTRGYV